MLDSNSVVERKQSRIKGLKSWGGDVSCYFECSDEDLCQL